MNTAILDDGPTGGEPEDGSPAAECSGVHPVQRLKRGDPIGDKYVVRGTLGAGGFAIVYDAEHVGLGRKVAIKVMHLEPDTPLGLIERFRQEARISAVVRHRNVLEVYDTGSLQDGSPYLVMERIDGETLYNRMARQGLTVPVVVEVARQLLVALSVIAERGIVHRDIKPENIMLHACESGEYIIKVLDFGISKNVSGLDLRLTRSGALIGTPHYMSAEQIRGEPVDIRSDIYAAGVVMYEALTGRVPYDGPSLNALVLAALNSDPQPIHLTRADCPLELERIIFKAMGRARDQRYATPTAMLEDLEALARSANIPQGANAWRAFDWLPPVDSLVRKALPAADASEVASPVLSRAPDAATFRRGHVLRLSAVGALLVLGTLEPQQATVSPRTPSAAPRAAEASLATPAQPAQPELDVIQLAPEPPILIPTATRESAARDRTQLRPIKARRARAGEDVPIAVARLEVAEQGASPVGTPGTAELAVASNVERAPAPSTSERAAPAARPIPAANVRHATPDHKLLRGALTAYVLGRLSHAHGLYRQAVAQLPQSPDAWRGLGIVAARRGYYDEARRALTYYLTLAPQAADASAIRTRIAALP